MNIRFFYDQVKFTVTKARKIRNFLVKVIREEKKIPGDLIFVFTNDIKELEINIKFLNHNFFTDIITFDYSSGDKISGEIYISVDTVKKNAKLYNVNFREELLRVMIHGILHLCGYNDESENEKKLMFKIQENLVNEFRRQSE